MSQLVGQGLFVRVGVDITSAEKGLNQLKAAAKATANEMNRLQGGSTGGGAASSNALAAAARNAADAQTRQAAAAQRVTATVSSQSGQVTKLTGNLTATAGAASKAADGAKKMGNEASQATAKVSRLGQAASQAQAGMYRFSQAFINLRYGNPLGVIVGLSQGMGGLARSTGSAGASFGLLGKAGVGVGAVIAAVGVATIGAAAGIYKLAAAGVGAASDLERMTISYEALLGSATRAREEVQFMQNLATESIVPTENLMEANRLLLAYGVTTDSTRRSLVQFFSDFAAATGLPASRLNDMAYALGQIEAQGKANQIDMRQLANAGLNLAAVYKEVAKQQGISAKEAQEMVAAGTMTADILYPAILKIGDGYKEAGEKARNSFSGIMANLGDIINVQASKAFQPVLKAITPILQSVEEFIQRLAPTFEAVGRTITESIGQIQAAFQGIDDSNNRMLDPEFWSVALPQAIKYVTQNILVLIATFRTLWEVGSLLVNNMMSMFWTLSGTIATAVAAMLNSFLPVVQGMADIGIIPQSWADAMGSATSSVSAFADHASSEAAAARSNIVNSANIIGQSWSRTFQMNLVYRVQHVTDAEGNYVGTPPPGGWNIPKPTVPDFSGGGGGGGSTGGGGGGKTVDKAKQQAEEYLKWAKEWAAKINAAWASIRGSLRQQFGELSAFTKAFTSGSIDTVIGMYNGTVEQVDAAYAAMIELAGKNKKQVKKLTQDQAREEAYLRKRTSAIIKLIRANERLEKKRAAQYKIDEKNLSTKWEQRLAEETKVVDKAVKDYEEANDKLEDLIDQRNSFVQELRNAARSFVNSFSLAEETVQKYTRLDGAGSFMVTEEKKTKSFKDTIRERLDSLKSWWQGITTLREKGFNEELIKELVSAGPEASAAVVNELAGASADVVAEVNQIQADLIQAAEEMGQTASAAWFDADIANQTEVVKGLEAIKDAAEQVFADLEALRDKEMEDLKTSYENYNDEIGQQIVANEKKIEQLTQQMNDRLKVLEKEFRKSGVLAIEGLILGLEEKEKDAKAAAKRIGDAIAKALKKALGINSPSKVGIYIGEMVSAGLAEGLASSVGDVQAASLRVASASLPVPSGVGALSAPEVRVFIGDTELTDIVRTEIKSADDTSLNRVLTGRRF